MLPVHALISVWGASSGGIWGSSSSGSDGSWENTVESSLWLILRSRLLDQANAFCVSA